MATQAHQHDRHPDWDDDYDEGHQQGRAEYDDGFALDDNPYDPHEQPHTHRGWRNGWIEAKDRTLDEGSAW